MKGRAIAALIISVSFLVSAELSAHHGAAVYDTSEMVTVTGPVTRFRFVFPHTLIYIAVPSDDGETVEWSGEMTTPTRLARGVGPGGTTHDTVWTNDTLKPGDIIELTGNPARNGAPSLRLMSVYDADGVALAGRRPGDTAEPVESMAVSAESSVADASDLTGVWIYNYSHRYENYAFTEEVPSMTPWGRELYEASKPTFGPRGVSVADTNDPVYECLPSGLPRIYAHPAPFEIVETSDRILILYEWMNLNRHIYTDGRAYREGRPPSWMGESVGHWEGDTFVVETVNFNDRTWVDRRGLPHSEELRVVERIRRDGEDGLTIDITVHDPVAYTEPWSARRVFSRADWRIEESVCTDNQSFVDFEQAVIDYEEPSRDD